MQGTLTRTYATNAVGDVTAFTGTDGVANTLTYDPFGRLASHTKSGATTTYTVNALDQRINKTGPTIIDTRYVYGGQNQLLGERNASNWTSYVWNGDEPVALVRGTQIYYLHADHLGRPQLATNASRSVVWKANYTAFNRGVNVDSIGGLNLGNPGQYLDAESGLWHNGYRDYDYTTGRYLQSDPIGLAGGTNTFVYVGGNPISWIDPYGLEVQVCRDPAFNGRVPANHYWIQTDTQSAGMGTPAAGANAGNQYDPLGARVQTVDHSNRPDSGQRECKVAKGADEDKVNKLIAPGRDLGIFVPGFNDCQHFVRGVLRESGGQFPAEFEPPLRVPRAGHE
jgi:RHS repeat-associated protein